MFTFVIKLNRGFGLNVLPSHEAETRKVGQCVGINGSRPREGRNAVRARAAKSATLPCHSIAASACFCDSVFSTLCTN